MMPNGEPAGDSAGDPGAGELWEQAHTLAGRSAIVDRRPRNALLLDHLRDHEKLVRAAYQQFSQEPAAQAGRAYAAEWLLDNYYLVQQAIRQVREDLPLGYYRQLPILAGPEFEGLPRIYALAHAVTHLAEGQIDLARLSEFCELFQQLVPLTMGELWAVPTMLRIVTIEQLVQALARLAGLEAAQSSATDAADEATVANGILSLRALGVHDWKAFFEQASLVERALRDDPAGLYAGVEFNTRDRYRKVVEEVARVARCDEVDVAQAAVDLAAGEAARLAVPGVATPDHEPWAGLHAPRTLHVGFFLVDQGRPRLEAALGVRLAWPARLGRSLLARAVPVFLGTIGLLTIAFDLVLVLYARAADDNWWLAVAAGLLALLPASTAAVDLVNWLVTHLVPPHTLPKLEFEDGIPAGCETIVVVPALLAGPADLDSLLRRLELHFLSNSDPRLWFALLTDFADAPQQHMPEDADLLAVARASIEALNDKHAASGRRPFLFFHRERHWNPSEECWMAWERKRGKLEEFNRLLAGDTSTSYIVQVGDLEVLPLVRYVITLDADTSLPWESARRLIGTLAHPLNRAEFDGGGRVAAGYTLLQPRVEIRPTSANRSLFTRIYAGDTGLDLYSRAVSNVYQDLFGEGIFVGKGIYDVAAFQRSLAGRVPENALLSHDLFEGIHGRAGLVTDIVLYEDYPPHYLVHAHRADRWIRGDWQLLPWLWRRVPAAGGRTLPNPLSALDLWKIVDNLRRSLFAPALILLLVAGWLFLPGSPFVWTIAAALAPAIPFVFGAASSLLSAALRGSFSGVGQAVLLPAVRWLLALVFLPFEAFVSANAIVVTLVRMFITRRHLLRWTSAAHAARLYGPESGAALAWSQMAEALALVAGLAVVVIVVVPRALPAALPLLAAWLISPQIAYWLSKPVVHAEPELSAAQQAELRRLARRTWLFFERFVGPDDHWLPPDHFQEEPRGAVAHRTSPTNVGLLLLSTLAASDLGYVGLLGMALRLRDTFATLDRLEWHRGHLLNWYDSRTLEPLPPSYVSTVDSGNLAACLIALRQGCLGLAGQPVLRWERWQGLLDTLALLVDGLPRPARSADPAVHAVVDHVAAVQQQVEAVRDDPRRWSALLTQVAGEGIPRLQALLSELLDSGAAGLDVAALRSLRLWAERVQHHLVSLQREYELLVPWLALLDNPPPWPADPDLQTEWQALVALLSPTVALGDIVSTSRQAGVTLAGMQASLDRLGTGHDGLEAARDWCRRLEQVLEAARMGAGSLLAAYEDLAVLCDHYVQAMDFRFLFDSHRQVFHLGYNVAAGQLDRNYYDLLASEVRIASLVAIAKGDVPPSHWLHLARPVTAVEGTRVLLSWSGTMFEYLMPRLLLRDFPGTLIAESDRGAVAAQMALGRQNGVPWGTSESGYYQFDANLNYQYRAFGVPALGFKRGLAEDQVISPYSSLLAVSISPRAVLENLARLNDLDMLGPFGYYEALDFTRSRLPMGQKHARVLSYMAHHQGMVLLSLSNYLAGERMIERFHQDRLIQSVELLLQERVPYQAPIEYPTPEDSGGVLPLQPAPPLQPWTVPVDGPLPEVHHLSNGRYSILVTSSGGGFSRWKDTDLTRWRADTTLDDWGTWVYIQDLDSGTLFSASVQPVDVTLGHEVLYYPHKAEYHTHLPAEGLTAVMEVSVPPDDDLEIRRVMLTNHTDRPRRLRLTTYGEVILAAQSVDRRHPAFNKLFIQSEYVAEPGVLIFRRRPRSSDEEPVYLAHWLATDGRESPRVSYETDRARFLGRGRTVHNPALLEREGAYLTGTVGATLDPILSLAQDVELEAYATVEVAFLTAAAASREDLLELAGRYQSLAPLGRALDRARAESERVLRELGIDTPALQRIEQLYSALLYPYAGLRADRATLAANTRDQSGLWGYNISGDYPVILARIESEDHIALVRELLQAHAYWRQRDILVDLVILNRRDTGYAQELQVQLNRTVAAGGGQAWLNARGGIFIFRSDQVPEADEVLLATVARAVFDGSAGSLAQQLRGLRDQPVRLPALMPTLSGGDPEPTDPIARPQDLLFDNGLGGFTADGREYVIYVEPERLTPAPWVNVVANPRLGFIASDSGPGWSWAENSSENRLTPWSNDPVTDRPGEALYLRDEETGLIWSPTPQPAGAPVPTLVRHGAGYTVFEHQSHGLRQSLALLAAPDEPVKIARLQLENQWQRVRRITVTYYAEWVLGTNREDTMPYVLSEYYPPGNALLARNSYSAEFSQRVAFAAASQPLHGLTADRAEFLGRMGRLAIPAALKRIGLAGAVDPGLDPCAAIQIHVNLQPGESVHVHFLVGQGQDRDEALRLLAKYQDPGAVETAWDAAGAQWDDLLSTVTVHTPDPSFDLLVNRWLLYQALSCRLWGRSALYQSGGAYGFRDQLQDVMALTLAAPHLVREHILRAARHQFEAGDVLHWWHPPSGRGIRSRCSDDLLWLPFVTAHYVAVTGDRSILSEQVSFLRGPQLEPGQDERYGIYESTAETYPLLEHCRRALERGSTAGPHGLPLMGSGDWNDGMNRVGIEGQGESVWLGWFLYAILDAFAALYDELGETHQAGACREQAKGLREALEAGAWDGAWYRRAYYDDGTPLGSARNRECQIDSIAQSWAVLSGAGEPDHAAQAMASLYERLVRLEDGLILLFAPPFDRTPRDPGYIKGYLPGIRENGGQYTHAALWAVWALTQLGQGDRAGALFHMLNPINHALATADLDRYRVEPYVVAADIYGVPPHTGRGGWTWYTGSAAWMYRLGIEAILGLVRRGDSLTIAPCIPAHWPGFELTVRLDGTTYRVVVENPDGVEYGVRAVTLNGESLPDGQIPLLRDGRVHDVRVRLGQALPGEGDGRGDRRFLPHLAMDKARS